MATHTVKQSGGDFSTLASALSDAGTAANDIISIEGTWTVDDTANATVSDNNITIQTDASSKHPGYYDESTSHYRLVESDGAHAVTVNNTGCVIDGLAIVQSSATGSSAEAIRFGSTSITVTVKNCLIQADQQYTDQDGIYTSSSSTLNIENTMVYGFNRSGIHLQANSGATVNANSCTFYYNGHQDNSGSEAGGGIGADNRCTTCQINVFNCIAVGNTNEPSAEDFRDTDDGSTWDIHNSIDSDASIDNRDAGASGCLTSRSETDSTSPGAGDWVIFEDITTAPYDLRLVSNAENDAEDMHSTASGAGMSIPSTDIIGTTRATAYECGAFTIAGAGGTTPKGPLGHPLFGPLAGPVGP